MTNRVFFGEFLRHRGGDAVSPQKQPAFIHMMPYDVSNYETVSIALIMITCIH